MYILKRKYYFCAEMNRNRKKDNEQFSKTIEKLSKESHYVVEEYHTNGGCSLR
jgi:hypothetical protein